MAFQPLTRTASSKHAEFLAEVLRRLARTEPDALDPWLPFPQNGCCFAFGRPPRPLPIGALRILWSEGLPFRQPCPVCGDSLHMISFGGLLSTGGGRLICPGCNSDFFQWIGGLATVSLLLEGTGLHGTPFAWSRMVFGGSVESDGAALLGALGLAPVIQDEEVVVRLEDGRRTRLGFNADAQPAKEHDE